MGKSNLRGDSCLNGKRRELLKRAVGYLDLAADTVSQALEDEEICLDNMPENLLDSERCIKMEEAISDMEDATEQIERARERILSATR